MGRVSQEQIDKLTAFLKTLPAEAKGKCALCNETLTHIVKQAEVQTGAGTATVTRVLADDINENAAPQDRVTPEQLRGRVQRNDGTICTDHADNQKPEEPTQATQAFHLAEIAINQLSRIDRNDILFDEGMQSVIDWINERRCVVTKPREENNWVGLIQKYLMLAVATYKKPGFDNKTKPPKEYEWGLYECMNDLKAYIKWDYKEKFGE